MPSQLEIVEAQALKLSPDERARLVDALLDSLHEVKLGQVEAAWAVETDRRVAAYERESGDASDAPPQLLLDKIARGALGVKTGKGFYRYPQPVFQTPGWLKGDED